MKKKYMSRETKWVAFFAAICSLMLLIGIILAVVNSSATDLIFVLIGFGGFVGIIFYIALFAEKSRWLTIDADEIVLPRGADHDGKMSFERTVVRMDEIVSVESKLLKGDQITTADCFLHTLHLKNGTKITFTLYAYGKEEEKEIIETIKSSIL